MQRALGAKNKGKFVNGSMKIPPDDDLNYPQWESLLEYSEFLESKPVTTPLDPAVKLHQDSSLPYYDIPSYRRLVGILLYLNATRPGITFCTQQLSQFLASPTVTHFNTTCRILRYLKTFPARGIFFPRDSSLQLNGYYDADCSGCLDTRRSVSGQCFFLGRSLISWRTKKQLIVSLSSSEAEYRALIAATCEVQWLLYLMKDLHVTCSRKDETLGDRLSHRSGKTNQGNLKAAACKI
ncbi:secreted RxLR effector protein 161-like [Vicia villosa]|uniref:secreted RxLR effector protein 161-like n=1 Tax=Vicia villosa TaxID=3911 RepID=UPI00273B47E1|nr:secreted RxLR effector protein 161-like [Vicia villosa]